MLFEQFDSLDDSTFGFEPPEDAEVREFETLEGLKEALATPLIVPRGSRVIIEHDWRVPANDD
jgi:hypothetical protein